MTPTTRAFLCSSALFLAGCGGGSAGSGMTMTPVTTPPEVDPLTLTDVNGATLSAFAANAADTRGPLFDEAQLTTPGSATYTGFVAIGAEYSGFRDVDLAGTTISVRTNYVNGPIGAAEFNVRFGPTPTLTGVAGNFVALSDADSEAAGDPSGEGKFAPNGFALDSTLPLIAIPGELTFTGSGLSTRRTLVDGVPDDSTARTGLSVRANGTLTIPAGVAGQVADRDLVVDNSVFVEVSDDRLTGDGTVEVQNGVQITRIHILADQ